MAEQAKVPAIRFAGFTDPWEQRKLGDVATRVTRKNEGESDLPLTISAQHGLVDQRTFFNNQVASKDMSGYYLLRKGEFAYNKSTSGDSPWGAVKRLVNYEKGCVSTLYICFGLDGTDPNYLVTYYETDCWHKGVQMIAAEGARNHGLLNIAPNDFFDTVLALPSSQEEQRRVGSFFSRLDDLITLHQRKYDKLVVFKKSMLEKMFPKDGESVPEIRFAGFTDPWEQRKLGEIASFSKGSGYSKADIRESGIPLFLYGRMYTQYETRVDSVDTFAAPRPGTLYSKGTEIVVPASGESAEDIARASAITREGIALGGDLNVVYPQRMVTPLFLAYGLSHGSSQKLLAQKAQGKTVVHIHASDLKGLGIAFPDVTEQQAIGTFFSSLDDLITLHQRKLELLQNIKKSLLDKMFV